MTVGDPRFEQAIAAIDAANADDPNRIEVQGASRPKEQTHSEMAVTWVHRLDPDPSEELVLAARGHHLRRWTTPRSDYPAGRAGYLRWRRDLHEQHARDLGELLARCGYPPDIVGRVQDIVRKRDLRRSAEVQTFEDALCLVFLQTQLEDLAQRLDADKLAAVLTKTSRKMSPRGLAAARALDLSTAARALLEAATRDPSTATGSPGIES